MKTAPNQTAFETALAATAKANDTPLRESIKANLLNGGRERLIDYPEQKRGAAMAAIAALRDELPIRCGWQTVRESHASETRTRVRTYSIPGEFLREVTGHD